MIPIPSLTANTSNTASAGAGATKIVVSGGTDNLNRAMNLWAGSSYNGGYPVSTQVSLTGERGGIGASISTPLGSGNVSLSLLAIAGVVGFIAWKKYR